MPHRAARPLAGRLRAVPGGPAASIRNARGGRCVNQPGDVRHAIRQKILAGVLPKEHCRMTWYGAGTGGLCMACDLPISASEIEVECDLPKGGTIRFHRVCYELWAEAWPGCEA
ncbi:MAG TPA: hypothetical protein VFP10_15715 [Candidatus Eisenbacteria bacterium]|nr:hypothetical protein [Candidatus Eisenbacteria bacterium]